MPPLDASIALGIKPPQFEGPLAQLAQVMAIRHAQDQGRLSDFQYRKLQKDEEDTQAIRAEAMKLPPGSTLADLAAIVSKVDPVKGAALMEKAQAGALRDAQIREHGAKADDLVRGGRASGMLADLLQSGGYQGNAENPVVSPPTGVMMNDTAALEAAKAADARGEQVGINVPSPGTVRGLAVLGKVPQGSLTELLKQTNPTAGNPQLSYDPLRGVIVDRKAGTFSAPTSSGGASLPARPASDPLVIVQGADGKPTYVPKSEAIGQTPGKASDAGSGSFTPETLSFTARQYLKGDRQAAQGFARNATARIALQNAIVEEAGKQSMSPEQLAAQMADFAGTVAGSRTVGQRGANISLSATEAQEMIGIVRETSGKFDRTNFVPWNKVLRAYETNTGSPEIAAFGASLNALVNVYARAIAPSGTPTVSDKEHAREILNSVQSPQQVDAVLGIINRELEIAKKAPGTVRAATRAGITAIPTDDVLNPQRRATDGQQSYPAPNAAAISRLRVRPAEKAQFEEIFGPGSADRALTK